MIYQISSGQGPAECELGVAKMLAYLENEYEITVLDAAPGRNPGTFRSARLETDEDLTRYAGSVQWVCRSPYRPNHGRKNWFLDFAVCARPETEAFRPDNSILLEKPANSFVLPSSGLIVISPIPQSTS